MRPYQLPYTHLLQITQGMIIAYLLGSLSSAILVCQLMRLPDPRTQGSRNPGATNVLRIGGKKAAAITLLGDMLKGFLPILLAKWLGFNEIGLACVAFAALMGHLFPIFFHFKGGKGVATFWGCLLALNAMVGLSWMVSWLMMALLFRYASLASLTASLFAPLYFWWFTGSDVYMGVTLLMALILIYRHRENIAKLLAGKENKIGQAKK